MKELPPKTNIRKILATYGGIGFELAAAVALGLFIGYYLDQKFKTSPFLMILGIIIGSAAGFFNAFRILFGQNNSAERSA